MFLRPLFWKTDEAGRFLFLFFISQKTDEATFFFFYLIKTQWGTFFCVHFKQKNADILILTFEKNEWGHIFFIQVWKKTDEGHLKQMREGLRNN